MLMVFPQAFQKKLTFFSEHRTQDTENREKRAQEYDRRRTAGIRKPGYQGESLSSVLCPLFSVLCLLMAAAAMAGKEMLIIRSYRSRRTRRKKMLIIGIYRNGHRCQKGSTIQIE